MFIKSVWPCDKIENKGGRLVKKGEFMQMKKNLEHQIFITKIFAFMTYGQFWSTNISKV